ncbi:MAG: UDP-N-acetylmuramoyl-L-alanyl-D-glutamate--2,6-diaminopimelate ligase [Oscillospiraceae bacterium]|nr:UDP-N-acetylmuramoyl-L-alanyl-D-glutamate--2,6-diaminopimelate ligase [Oscillospiraceae bacterium]
MKLQQLLDGVEYNTMLSADTQINTITCDSRRVEKGSLFVCIKGERFDGHDHAAKALEDGAAAVVCQRDLGLKEQILVSDSRLAYALLCRNFFGRACDRLKLIGVTGTNGKTTITFLIKHILEAMGKKVGLMGTVENQIGDITIQATHTTPDPFQLHSLFSRMVKAGCEYAVLEVSSHAMAQHRLAGCHFACGIFTNLTQDHLDYHKTMENYYLAKRSLFEMADLAVVNYDDEAGQRIMQEIKVPFVSYSVNKDDADYTAHGIIGMPAGSRFDFVGKQAIGRITFSMPGDYSVSNAMAAAAAVLELGFPVNKICAALTDCPGVPGRTEVIPTNRDFTVIRDFAHSPDGLEKVISTVRRFAKADILVVFGCAGERDRTKRNKMTAIVSKLADRVIFTLDNPRNEDPRQIEADSIEGLNSTKTPYEVVDDRCEAIRRALAYCKKDDILLLLGKGHEDYQVLDFGTVNFDERKIVLQLLAEQ